MTYQQKLHDLFLELFQIIVEVKSLSAFCGIAICEMIAQSVYQQPLDGQHQYRGDKHKKLANYRALQPSTEASIGSGKLCDEAKVE